MRFSRGQPPCGQHGVLEFPDGPLSELVATLPGVPLYRALGFEMGEQYAVTLPDGVDLPVERDGAVVGGVCDEDAALSFKSNEGGYRLQLTVSPGARGCQLLVAVPRGVRIVTSTAIPVSSIEPTGSG